MALLACYNGPIEQGEAVLRPLREFGPAAGGLVAPIPLRAAAELLDEGFPFGLQNYWKSEFLKALSDEAIDVLVERFAVVPSPLTAIVLEQFGGAYRRVASDENAFSHRDWDYNFLIISRWTDPADADRNIQWARDLWQAVQPFASGAVYVNYLEGGEEGAGRIRSAYGAGLRPAGGAEESKYDPSNFFPRTRTSSRRPDAYDLAYERAALPGLWEGCSLLVGIASESFGAASRCGRVHLPAVRRTAIRRTGAF